jgi:ABC-type Zn uptake system ZnuABC Zn-binding protein ZnuA
VGLLALLAAGCGDEASDPVQLSRDASGPLIVFTVNEPLRTFAARIGEDAVPRRSSLRTRAPT